MVSPGHRRHPPPAIAPSAPAGAGVTAQAGTMRIHYSILVSILIIISVRRVIPGTHTRVQQTVYRLMASTTVYTAVLLNLVLSYINYLVRPYRQVQLYSCVTAVHVAYLGTRVRTLVYSVVHLEITRVCTLLRHMTESNESSTAGSSVHSCTILQGRGTSKKGYLSDVD